MRPHAAALRTALFDDARPDAARLAASAGLGRLVSADPAVDVDLVDDLVSTLDSDDGRLRSNVAGIVCDLAMVHTDVVAPHVDALVPLLSADETYARVNASGAIGRVAADFPDAVDHHRERFVDLLSDDDERVRENTCWTLGRIGTADTREVLETVARTDDRERVRERASWAVANVESETTARDPTDT